MGRKKKGSVNSNATYKSSKEISKCDSSSTPDTNSLDSDNASASQDTPGENDSQDSSTMICDISSLPPKKIGKYRCLLLNDRKYANGPLEDGEENDGNSMLVDNCIGSESDSNSPAYASNQRKDLKTFSKADSNAKSSTSIDKTNKGIQLFDTIEKCRLDSVTLDVDSRINLDNVMDFDTKIPDPTLHLISKSDPRHGAIVETALSQPSQIPQTTAMDEHNEEEEMITVFEIIDENGSENTFYESKSEDAILTMQCNVNNECLKVPLLNEIVSEVSPSYQEYTNDNILSNTFDNFEHRLNNMNISFSSNLTVAYENCSERENVETEDIVAKSTTEISENKEFNISNHKIDKVEEKTADPTVDSSSSTVGVRRSSRIKIISDLKQRSKGRGLVKAPSKKLDILSMKDGVVKASENLSESLRSSPDSYPASPTSIGLPPNATPFPIPNVENDPKPVKVKSRWRRSSEMEMGGHSPVTPPLQSPSANNGKHSSMYEHSDVSTQPEVLSLKGGESCQSADEETQKRLKQFQTIYENEYHCDRTISKEARKMTCDCFLTKDEIERGELGCGEDCLNRLLMIECNSRCPVGDRCTNRRFQSRQYSKLKVMKTEKKGLGLQAIAFIHGGDFLMEYVGEVLNSKQFNKKAEEYSSSEKNIHHYFMALKGDAVIDATLKGNISRFINHSCDPNSETQKWTVNGELRIGFFSKRDILAGEEITFDYQFQRYGKEAQKCYCEASNCRGWIGDEPDTESEEEEEEEEEEIEEKKPIPGIKIEVEDDKVAQIEIKEEIKTDKIDEESTASPGDSEKVLAPHKKKDKPKKFARAAKELFGDVDLEEDMEMLSRSGIKNQSHTLSLCRAMVRAKRGSARATLLTLLASADLPCRRLFLDYRGLRLLAPWCQDANASASFKLKILITLEKLPIPNKSILQECNLLTYLQKWLSLASPIDDTTPDDSDNSRCGTPTLIDENTGLPVELPIKLNHKSETAFNNVEFASSNDVSSKKDHFYDSEKQKEEIAKLCKLLLDRWSQLKEVFKIPKKERIEIMKEHERQANEPHNKKEPEKEVSKVKKSRWDERYARPERQSDRDKKRSRQSSPDSSRKRLPDDRSSLTKEERRREFAERAAREEQMRRTLPIMDESRKGPLLPLTTNICPSTWMPPPEFMQGMPPFGPMMMNGLPPPDFLMSQGYPPNFMPMDYMQQKPFVIPYCGPPPMFITPQGFPMMGPHPPFPPGGFHTMTQPPPGILSSPIKSQQVVPSIPPPTLVPSIAPQPSMLQRIPIPPNLTNPPPTIPRPQTPPLQQVAALNTPIVQHCTTLELQRAGVNLQIGPQSTLDSTAPTDSTLTDENLEIDQDIIVPFAPVRLPPHWRSVKDARGRTYYYHVKIRTPQWEPPIYSPTPHFKEDGNSMSEEESSEEETIKEKDSDHSEEHKMEGSKRKVSRFNGLSNVDPIDGIPIVETQKKFKKDRPGLVTSCWIISPRREEDRIANQIEMRRYKENKEKLRRRKEQALLATAQTDAIIKYKKKLKDRHKKSSSKKKKECELLSDEVARKKKDMFKVNMAKMMVHYLNPYRKDDCPLGRITNNEDFKHLARKLSHFVLLKELKHCKDVNDLECNDSVKLKAKEFVKKYMSKFGPAYERPPEEMD